MKRKVFTFLLTLLLILWAGFIFSNSMEDVSASYETSAGFIRMIDAHLLDNEQTAFLVQGCFRKAAHFFEFFLLGTLFYFLLARKEKPGRRALLFSVLAAFVDEGLQMFSDRGNSLKDVLLDSCGAAAAIGLLIAIRFLIRRKKTGEQNEKFLS